MGSPSTDPCTTGVCGTEVPPLAAAVGGLPTAVDDDSEPDGTDGGFRIEGIADRDAPPTAELVGRLTLRVRVA